MDKLDKNLKSVKSQNLCESVIQTSYDIVKAHGGKIEVESMRGNGTKFNIELPIIE